MSRDDDGQEHLTTTRHEAVHRIERRFRVLDRSNASN